MAFQTIRPRYVGDLARHEAGHCAAMLTLVGTGTKSVRCVNLKITRVVWPSNDKDKLTILAAGIRACQHFGSFEHHGGGDVSRAVEIWSKMPRQAAEWREALDRAAEIIRVREAFVDELGHRLEYEGELSGDVVDQIWLSFYPAPELTQRCAPAYSSDEGSFVYNDDFRIGVVRRQLDGQYLAEGMGSWGAHRVLGPNKAAAEKGLRRLVA